MIDDVPVFYRTAGDMQPGGAVSLYLHEALTSSEDWTSFLERTGGVAPDLIGFGRSGKGGHLDYSPQGLTNFVARVVEVLNLDRLRLIGHGWGAAIALLLALREPDRVERVVLIDAIPLLQGWRWHTPARIWRRPVLGELAMGATTRRALTRELRAGVVRRDAWPDQCIENVWEQFDQGTQRALLRLHRAADEGTLAELGKPLASLTASTLIVAGERDRWVAPQFADAYASILPHATLELIAGAGHWPWLDEPRVIEMVAAFLG